MEHWVQEIDGLEDAPVQLTGPASGAPELGRLQVAGEETGQGSEEGVEVEQQPAAAALLGIEELHANVTTASIAVDPSCDSKDTHGLEDPSAQTPQWRRERSLRVLLSLAWFSRLLLSFANRKRMLQSLAWTPGPRRF